MGFTPAQVGLDGERVTAHFREPRPNGCPHRGLDISSSGTPKPFVAGIFGQVVEPAPGGEWGTIAVAPLSQPATRVQYLHCSRAFVSVGQMVTPWMVVGLTGDTAPPGTGITGVHLHIQVIKPGGPAEPCWGQRNFVDPESWADTDIMAGTWLFETSGPSGAFYWSTRSVAHISGSAVGSVAEMERQDVFTQRDCRWVLEGVWRGGRVVARSAAAVDIELPPGVGQGAHECGISMNPRLNGARVSVALLGTDQLRWGKAIFRRVGRYSTLLTAQVFEVPMNPDSPELITAAEGSFGESSEDSAKSA